MAFGDQPKGVTGRKWRFLKADEEAVAAMVARGVAEPVARIMSGRGVTVEGAEDFLVPKISKVVPPSGTFPGMKEAVKLFCDAVEAGEKIGIWTDYDCDGATSAATLGRFLRMCGHEDFQVRVPDRIAEGYGPNRPGIDEMFAKGCQTIFVLDSGTVATAVFDPMPEERRRKIAVIDHHLPGEKLPDIAAVVNPNRKDQAKGLGHLCAAGVTFFFCVEAAKELSARKFLFPARPDLTSLLDVVALGTVADVVPLTTVNRAIVERGLRVMNESPVIGIAELIKASGADKDGKKADAYTCGFMLGPRINAEGRIGDAAAGVNLLLERNPVRARDMALALNETNRERQEMEKSATEQAKNFLSDQDAVRPMAQEHRVRIAIVDAHEGVVGISASRIKDVYNSPAIVLTQDHEGNLKGSARSVAGFDIGTAIHKAAAAGLIIKGGGHAMAGGVTLRKDQVEAFETFLNEEILLSEYGREGVFEDFDAVIQPEHVSFEMVEEMGRLAPFGMGNPTPRVVIPGMTVVQVGTVGKNPNARHLAVFLETDEGSTLKAMMFNVALDGNGPEERALRVGRTVTIAGKLELDTFGRNRAAKLMISDVLDAPEPRLEIEDRFDP